jgi:hypothetical protein
MAMWRVRKKIEGGKYQTIFESRDRNDALSQFRAEYRLLLESQPHYTREQIDSQMDGYDLKEYEPTHYWYYNRSVTRQCAGTYLRLYKAEGKDAMEAVRPTRTEALDKILGIEV